ncbi:unnamed protein product [Lactuca saligna]|uniref:Uncharacterized protein n=1 Tax=Lactuca saligna TaxID=75948 RepID=A0AA35VD71_LACSI|nr:unnamed protein product [Lactuca saligna]
MFLNTQIIFLPHLLHRFRHPLISFASLHHLMYYSFISSDRFHRFIIEGHRFISKTIPHHRLLSSPSTSLHLLLPSFCFPYSIQPPPDDFLYIMLFDSKQDHNVFDSIKLLKRQRVDFRMDHHCMINYFKGCISHLCIVCIRTTKRSKRNFMATSVTQSDYQSPIYWLKTMSPCEE